MPIDLVTLFAIVVFTLAWFLWSRTPTFEPLVRLFFATLMVFGAAIGILGYLLRLYLRASP